ncbi:MAG: FAD-dependent oxidoreductase, partial [Candidatus Moranbacteria bacterium]|nr:FAD-dependent oxidoreductase [Candidatus Moranbacteria bacterium]
YNINHRVIGKLAGGLISETHLMDNYLGIEDINGFEFGQKITKHVKKYKAEILADSVISVEKEKNFFHLQTENGKTFRSRTILLATGTQRRKLNIAGEEKFLGKGVSYCATCDGFFYKNKTVAVVGGNDSAVGAALYLAGLAEKVYLIYRQEKLRAEPFWVKQAERNKKIEIIYKTNLTEIDGRAKVEKVKIDKKYQGRSELKLGGVFIEIGTDPDQKLARALAITADKNGLIKVKNDQTTNVLGAWAAGDITTGSDGFRQVITAAAEGAIAARSIYNFLQNEISPKPAK